ncbi:endonuclease domain-containing protein [Psychroserpens sp. XS_ASV72]|uniref:endonuclease domain-containing protein n=1 Tax=Psychroserpens sp. XS_ASV72 TaxID=3241293 RepID=UPI00351735F6
MNNELHNRKYLKEFRKTLRNNPTKAESKLWQALRKRQLEGRKFRRQHSIVNYIVDFYCPEEKLVIEVDGSVHHNTINSDYDHKRTEDLNAFGLQVIRFTNDEVFESLDHILERIKQNFKRK